MVRRNREREFKKQYIAEAAYHLFSICPSCAASSLASSWN